MKYKLKHKVKPKVKPKFNPEEANKCYERLGEYTDLRRKELSEMMEPYLKIIDRYGRLISRIVWVLGHIKPVDTQDIVIRDLLADVFDSLYEANSIILSGRLNIAFAIGRRAFESLSLLHLCTLDKSWAEKWQKGEKIGNAEVRKQLAAHAMGEPEEQTRKLYNFFCLATHPNRDLIQRRFLGEGNQFVLGAIGKPDLVAVVDHCTNLLQMWFWFTATVSYFYREKVSEVDNGYGEAYFQAAEEAAKVKQSLVENYNRLLKEEQEYWAANPVKE